MPHVWKDVYDSTVLEETATVAAQLSPQAKKLQGMIHGFKFDDRKARQRISKPQTLFEIN